MWKINVGNDYILNYDASDIDTNDNKGSCRKRLERAKKNIIPSILSSNTYFQQSLALHSDLISKTLLVMQLTVNFIGNNTEK